MINSLAWRLLNHQSSVLDLLDKQDFDAKFLKNGKYTIEYLRMWHYTYSYTEKGKYKSRWKFVFGQPRCKSMSHVLYFVNLKSFVDDSSYSL